MPTVTKLLSRNRRSATAPIASPVHRAFGMDAFAGPGTQLLT